MNSKAIKFIKNFSYTLSSNLISLMVSTLIVLVVPKLIGVEEYGYWQLYLFYSLYVGFLHFGWIDGIYLRYGGAIYEKLDKKLFFSQFWMLVLFQSIISLIIVLISILYINDQDKLFIFKMIAVCLFITNIRYMLLYILQCTNRIKEYARITMMDRILYCSIIIGLLLLGSREYKLMILADIIGRILSLIYAIYCCKEIIFLNIKSFKLTFKETRKNISVGKNLMFSTISSILIIGIVRFGIENSWDVSTFGKVSLTLSISNIIMQFINAIGIIMFPILRRTDSSKLKNIYITMRDFLMIILLGALIIYYPFKVVLLNWLPQYEDSLKYMAIVFPMCIFEGKMALLINTYLKTLRKEKLMLRVNLMSVALSLILTLISTILMKNLNLAIISIVILLAFKCILSELYLSKILKISVQKDVILEIVMTLVFILTGWFINSWFTVLIYGLAYLIYIFLKKKDVYYSINTLKILINK